MVDSLIKAYGLTNHMDMLKVKPSTYNDLTEFHSSAYIDYLKKLNDNPDSKEDEAEFGIGY